MDVAPPIKKPTPAPASLRAWLLAHSLLATSSLIVAGAFVVSGVLLVLDTRPGFLHSETRNIVSSVPLILVAIGYLAQQLVVRPPASELAKRVALSVAFLLWGFGQLVPDWSLAPALNDLAIGLFVFDLALITWDDHRRHVREIAAVEADAAPPARPEAR